MAEAWKLPRVGARPPFFAYVGEMWHRRQFVTTMARFRMRASTEGNRLGIAWIVLRPLLNALIYGSIFGILQGSSRPPGYAAYVVVGVFLFEFFTGCFNGGSKSVNGNRNLVQSLAFPRIALPLAVAVESLFQYLVMLVVLGPILIAFGHYPHPGWLVMIPLVILFTLLNTGVAFITARLTVHVSDFTQLLPFISRILFYTSGVLFNVNTILAEYPTVLRLYDFNPLYQVLAIARYHLIGTDPYPTHYWVTLAISSVVVFVGGAIFFWQAEERYGRD